MPEAQLPPLSHLQLRINRAIKVFNRAVTAAERDTFTSHHFHSVRMARDEITSLAARFRDRHWGNLHMETTEVMAELTEEMEQLMHDIIQPAFNRRDERITHRPGEYTQTRVLEFQGTHYRKDIPCANPAYALAKLDEWEAQLVGTLVGAESRA